MVFVVFPLCMLMDFHFMGYGGVLEPLMLPFTLVIAIGAGLRLRFAGALGISIMLLLVVIYAWARGLGIFGAGTLGEHLLFAVSLLVLFVAAMFFCALVAGYHLRSAEIANEREHLMHRVLDALPIGVWVRSPGGETVFVNERWASFSAFTVEEIMRSDSCDAPVDLGEQWEAEREELLNSDDGAIRYQYVDLEDRHGCLSSMTLLTLKVYIDDSVGVGTLSLLVDETALRLYEEQIRLSERRLRMALDTVGMGFWDFNLSSGEIYRDTNWCRILEVNAATVSHDQEEWKRRLHPNDRDRVLEQYADFLHKGAVTLEIDYRILKGASHYIWVHDRMIVQDRDAEGRPTHVMGTMQDISGRKQIELDLKEAKERAEAGNQAKGHFIATISHEIRTPLNAIIGLSSFLKESDLNTEQLDLSETICSSGRSLLLLVNDILDFSKIEAGRLELEMQEYPLHLCFEDCVKLFKAGAADRNVALRLSMDPSLPEFALGDMGRLRQVVQNLVANALKFTGSGSVEIAVRAVHLSELPVERQPNDAESIGYLDEPDRDYLEVVVRDTGIGIPEDRQDALFEAFSQVDASTTRKYGGTGLGLAICKRLVQAMGGQIWVESREGSGALFGFVVRIKLIEEVSESRAQVGAADGESVQRIAAQYPCAILVVGDRDQMASLMLACRRSGYSPHYAQNYDLSEGALQRRRYNVIFIDMGREAEGLELARQICASSKLQRPQAVIGVLPVGQSVSKERCKLVGMQRFIEGGYDLTTIQDLLVDVLSARD
jgi:signal transduction histidine kinase